MWFRPCLLLILIFTTVSLCKPAKQDENGGEDDDYDHEEGDREEAPVVEDKAPPDDGSPEYHKIYDTRLQTHDADAEEQPAEHDKKISGEAENKRQERLSQSKRHYSVDLSKAKDKQNVGDKLAEIEEEGADLNYDGAAADIDWKLDYVGDREINNKFNIQPVQHKNIGNKKNKHWFDFYRNRRHVQNTKMQITNNNNEKGPEDEETAIKRHIKKLTTDELELLLKSLSDEKRILLQSIIDSDENVNKREITKKAAAEEQNEENMMIEGGARQSESAVHETEADSTQKSLVTMKAKTLQTRSADINDHEDKMDSIADVMDSEYDFNESAMLQSAKAETKRDAREEYDAQSDDPDDDDENVKSNSDRRISNRRLQKREDIREDSLSESMKSLEESFAKNLNLDSEMVPLVRVKRTHDNGQNYTRNNISRLEVEEDNELYNNEAKDSDNITSHSQLQASLVSAEGENVLDTIENSEPDIAYTINDDTPEIKNWNLINCSCENVSFESPPNLQEDDDDANGDSESRRSAKGYLAIDDQKHEGQITPSLKLIENNSSEKVSMYHDSEVVDPILKTRGLQRYKRIRRVKQTQVN